MRIARPWNRLLWGVVLTEAGEAPVVLGDTWARQAPPPPGREGEPTRALLFTTRRAAREWGRKKRTVYVVGPLS